MAQAATSNQMVEQNSDAFRSGYAAGLENVEHTGWPIDEAPQEGTLVDLIYHVAQIIRADNFDDYELRWIAGLITGWFGRGRNG